MVGADCLRATDDLAATGALIAGEATLHSAHITPQIIQGLATHLLSISLNMVVRFVQFSSPFHNVTG